MENLASLIRVIRMAQGITQRDLARYVGIHPSAVALFEVSRSKLSLATILRMAPFLSLNPDFLRNGSGAPIKPRRRGQLIKLFLSMTPESGVDYYLLDLILAKTEKAEIAILLPLLEEAKGKLGTPGLYYALAVQDSESIVYLFRGRDGERLAGSVSGLLSHLDTIASKGKKDFHVETVRVRKELFEELRTWLIHRAKELLPLLMDRGAASRESLLRLVDTIPLDDQEREAVRKAAEIADVKTIDAAIGSGAFLATALLRAAGGEKGATVKPLRSAKLTRDFFMKLEEGRYIVSPIDYSGSQPYFAGYLGRKDTRMTQWERVENSGMKGKLAHIFRNRQEYEGYLLQTIKALIGKMKDGHLKKGR